MNPVTVISTALQKIPARVRYLFLLGFVLAFVLVRAPHINDLPHAGDVEDVLNYLGAYLGLQSAANVALPSTTPGAPENTDDGQEG